MSNTTYNNSENRPTVLTIRTIFNIIRRLLYVVWRLLRSLVTYHYYYYYFYEFQENRKTTRNSNGDSRNRRKQYWNFCAHFEYRSIVVCLFISEIRRIVQRFDGSRVAHHPYCRCILFPPEKCAQSPWAPVRVCRTSNRVGTFAHIIIIHPNRDVAWLWGAGFVFLSSYNE